MSGNGSFLNTASAPFGTLIALAPGSLGISRTGATSFFGAAPEPVVAGSAGAIVIVEEFN